VLGYVYIDIVQPQRLSYYLLNVVPISQIFFIAALIGWVIADDKSSTRMSKRQWGFAFLLVWAGFTTFTADFPVEALEKWAWVWPSMVFAIFLPFTLRTRLRIEALLVFMILSGASIVIIGAIKTLLSGGGYGVLHLGVDNNSGLYEGSIVSTFAIALIPLILFFRKSGTIFPPDWRVNLFCIALAFACLLMPIGTEARTGLVCIAALFVLLLRDVKRRILYLALAGSAALVAIPFLPSSFSQRMETIEGYQGDESASTRIAVWAWTLDYVKDHPLGGGFEAYRQNKLSYQTVAVRGDGNVEMVSTAAIQDEGRAYHSSYFEMLGEQGWPGFLMWFALHITGLVRMEILRRRYRKAEDETAWVAGLATALQSSHIIYLVGSLFVGIAFQSFAYMWIAVQIGLDAYCSRLGRESPASWRKGAPPSAKAIPAAAP
jgi:probable O-glycosylation ligase (exosortase A-associated)